MARKRKLRKHYGNIANRQIEDFHERDEARRTPTVPVAFIDYPVVNLPQPLASMTVLGLTKLLKTSASVNYKENEVVLIFAQKSTNDSYKNLNKDITLYSIFVNALHMGHIEDIQDLPVNSYVGYIVLGEKVNNGYRIIDASFFQKPMLIKPGSVWKCLSQKAVVGYVRLENGIITVPLSDKYWQLLKKREGYHFPYSPHVLFFWKPSFCRLYSSQYGFGNEEGLYDIVFINNGRKRRYSQNNGNAITREKKKVSQIHELDALVIHFDQITFKPDENTNTFDIINKKEWVLDWNQVMFKHGFFVIYPPTDSMTAFRPKVVSCPGSIESFNYLKNYLNERLPAIRCSIKEMKLFISDEILLNDAIAQFSTAYGQISITTDGTKRTSNTSNNQIPFQHVPSKAQQLTAEAFEKYKSRYIDYLTKLQSQKYKIIPCVERLTHTTGGDMTEYAFMFTIPCGQERFLIIHENVNPDRSTLLFLIENKDYGKTIKSIYDFLQSAEINKRSNIRESAIRIKSTDIIDYKSINHNEFFSWHSAIEDYIEQAITAHKKVPNLLKTKFSTLSRLLREIQSDNCFEKVKPIFKMLNLPLNRKVTPSYILARVPESNYYIDADGSKQLFCIHRYKKYERNSKGEKVEAVDKEGNPVYGYRRSLIHRNSWSLEVLISLLGKSPDSI